MATVQQIIESLKTLPQDLEVYASKDEEGNGYNPIDRMYVSYANDDGYEISPIHPSNLDDCTEEERKELKQVVILW